MSNTEKTCPACAESIKLEALVCRYCGNKFDPDDVQKSLERINAASKMKADSERAKIIDDAIDFGIYVAHGLRNGNPLVSVQNLLILTPDQFDEGVKQLRGAIFESDMFDDVREWATDHIVKRKDCSNEIIIKRANRLGMRFVELSEEEISARKRKAKELEAENVAQKERDREAEEARMLARKKRKPFILAGVCITLLAATVALGYAITHSSRDGSGLDQRSSTVSSGSGGMSYETCKSLFQPDFESCLNRSDLESDWNRCKKSFFDSIEQCTSSATTGAATTTSQCRTFNGRRFCGEELESVRVRLDRQISEIERSDSECLDYQGATICGSEAKRVVAELKAARDGLK